MQANQIHGSGQIIHQDSGNVFEGNFVNGYKHGPAKFILSKAKDFDDEKTGIFKGHFEHNVES